VNDFTENAALSTKYHLLKNSLNTKKTYNLFKRSNLAKNLPTKKGSFCKKRLFLHKKWPQQLKNLFRGSDVYLWHNAAFRIDEQLSDLLQDMSQAILIDHCGQLHVYRSGPGER